MSGGSQVALAVAGMASFIYFLALSHQPASDLKTMVKTLATGLLALAAVSLGADYWLIAGLVACALGDYFLSKDTDRTMMLAMIAFGGAHIIFAILFLGAGNGLAIPAVGSGAFWAMIGLLLLAVLMFLALWPKAGALRLPVTLYIPLITAMGLAALTMPFEGRLQAAIIGAGLFILSDVLISLQLFVLKPAQSAHEGLSRTIWSTYWIGLFMIFWTFAL